MFLKHKAVFSRALGTRPYHVALHPRSVRSAIPANDGRVADLVRLFDRDDVPIAATWREVSEASERLGLLRPSYGHVRRLVLIERRRRDLRSQAAKVLVDAGTRSVAGLVPSVSDVAVELHELRLAEERVLQEHKAFAAAQLSRSKG